MLEQFFAKSSGTKRPLQQPGRRLSLRVLFSVALTLGVLLLAYVRRDKVFAALQLLDRADLGWLVVAFLLVLLSFGSAALVYDRALRSAGERLGMARLWGTAVVAILVSQSVPGGGLASYAFLVESFRRRGVAVGSAALVASLEVLSYVGAMLIFFTFGLFYIAVHTSAELTMGATLLAGGVAVAFVGTAAFVLTRPPAVLRRWLVSLGGGAARLLRRDWNDRQVDPLIEEVVRARTLVVEQWGQLLLLVAIQLMTLLGHSLALLVVLWSLGSHVPFAAVVSAFGIALVTSTFNVLPGGGGTVEAVLSLTLSQLGAGDEALAAAVIFRILNFWLLVPIALFFYRSLMRRRV